MTPAAIANLALGLIGASLQVIAEIKGQGGMTDDEIIAAAQTTDANTLALIKTYLAQLPTPAKS